MSISTRSTRAVFVAAAALVLVASTAAALAARPADLDTHVASPAAATHPTSLFPAPNDRWLGKVTGKHRQLFDSPAPGDGIPLVHILNFYQTLNRAYHVKDADIDGIGTFYGATTFYGVNDAMWAKYRLGEFLQANDPATGKPAVANPWRAAPVILGMSMPQASIESLQRRGATFILCNNALTLFAGMVARARGLDADAVYADLAANILPDVELVPAMVVAIEQAHAAGISYHRQ
jgi:hypothetical protein